MTAKHRAAVEALKVWAIEANHPAGLALACQALDAAFGDNDAEAQAFFTMWRDSCLAGRPLGEHHTQHVVDRPQSEVQSFLFLSRSRRSSRKEKQPREMVL
jgi:hypothetical protein